MGALEVVHPADRVAGEDAGLPPVAWAETRRAEMARLVAELRSIQSKRDEALGLESSSTPDSLTSSSIVPLLEAKLAAAMARIDAAAAAAHERTGAVVAGAVRRAGELQRSAEDAQARLVPSDRIEPPAPVPAHLRIDPCPGVSDPWAALDDGPVDPRLDGLGPVVDLRDPAQVHDAFWREVLADAPVRTRLRRWVQGEAS
jgi:hypothetical protein